MNIEKEIKQMTKYMDEKAKEAHSQSLCSLEQTTCLLILLSVTTSSYKDKELLIKILMPVRNLSCVVLGRPVGIVGSLVHLYLMKREDGQRRNYLDTDVSERLA